MNISPTKINLYKFVSTTGIAAASDAKKEEKANISIQTKQVEAINQLGEVVNGFDIQYQYQSQNKLNVLA